MMEVVAEPAWNQQFKEEVEIMEEGEGDAAAGELLTREFKKRLLDHAAQANGNGHGHDHVNGDGGEEEEAEASQEEDQQKNVFFDPAKVPDIITAVSARYLVTESAARSGAEEKDTDEAHENDSAHGNGSCSNGSHQVPYVAIPESAFIRVDSTEIFPAEVVDKDEHVAEAQPEENGSHSQVPFIAIPESAFIRVDKTEIFPAEVPMDAHVADAQPEENGSHHQVPYVAIPESAFVRVDKTEIFPAQLGKDEHVAETQPEENGSHQASSSAIPEIAFIRVDKTEILPAQVHRDEHVVTEEAEPEIEEYDLEKVLDQQETHDLYCPNCRSCITRRVILRKRKRTARLAASDEPPKRPHTEVTVPSAPAPEEDVPESPEVFRCLSCFSFFIPTGCSLNIFRIFGRRDQHVDVLPPPASEDVPPSENCTSWLLSCFQPGDSPHQAATTDSLQIPLLHDTAAPGDTTTTTTETSASYAHSHDTVVKPDHSTDESSSSTQQTTTTTTTTTTTASGAATTSSTTTSAGASSSTSSHTASSTGLFHTDEMEVITGKMPAGGAVVGATTHHLIGHDDVQGPATPAVVNGSFPSHATHASGYKVDSPNLTTAAVPGIISRGDMPISSSPRAADPPHVAVSVPEDVNPRPHLSDEWDILKAIVYGGLVELITSLSLVAAAASSGAKTLDIFILGIANLIGGLPLIFHNIADLRDIQDVDGTDERVGHYWMNLGRRTKSQRHMVTALLSYIIFGLLPPVLYGLSFRESNKRENKMIAVAGASLACIALLGLGKAHVKDRHRTYFKTLMYYVSIALSCSGLSYVAGMLITRLLLVNFGIIDEGGASGIPAPPGLSSFPHVVGAQTSAWASF